ncbi:MAG: MBL fold metallo-hydrolase [Sphingomonadales bacterium]|nr:MBL fold metallo-hydrolase [Sphingomonadales bacterium]
MARPGEKHVTAKGPQLTFHGAAGTVTGSCMEFVGAQARVLVDCGLFQGSRTLETLNHGHFAFDPRKIDAVVLTHAHIDHCGLLPKLVRDGFAGPIFCTPATADLLRFMLADAGRIQESDALRRNRRRDRAGEAEFQPLYTEADALKAWGQARPVPLCEWFEPAPGFRTRFWNAGHILGSASAELVIDGCHVLCSGDLGPDNKEFHPDPQSPSGVDHVICESTYGDRAREKLTIEQRRDRLEAEIKDALVRGGNLVIPTFALERTQELVLDVIRLAEANRIPNVPVFVDSPLASQATRVFAQHAGELEDLTGIDICKHPSIHYTEGVAESQRLNSLSGAIILAASGMCEAGRIRHHLRHNLHRRDSTILFVGFQAAGTLGRVLVDGAQRVRLSGEDVTVRARIRRIDSYSAHADRDELHAWIKARLPISGSLFLSHGEPDAVAGLRDLVQPDDPALKIHTPRLGEVYELRPATPAKRLRTGRIEVGGRGFDWSGPDWQNDYAAFTSSLRSELSQIRSPTARRKAIARMKQVLAQAQAE